MSSLKQGVEIVFSRKAYRNLLLSGMGVFFIIALSIYLYYISIKPNIIVEEPLSNNVILSQETLVDEPQTVMAQDVIKIKGDTIIEFEIVDQFGVIRKTESYQGMNWLGYSKVGMSEIFPDYVITSYKPEKVTLTRVIERQVEPSYIITTQGDDIVISTRQNGHKVFYKETGLGQHDFSEKLGNILEKGIPITLEQKEAILEDENELYKILQEYDE